MKRKKYIQKNFECEVLEICKVGLLAFLLCASLQLLSQPILGQSKETVSEELQIFILRSEDERRWNDRLKTLLSDESTTVRERAALAAGRIGDERAIEPLSNLLEQDRSINVQSMAAFALGEIESVIAVNALIKKLQSEDESEVRAYAVEALGKIGAALPQSEKEMAGEIGKAILIALERERTNKSHDNKITLKGLTAALRVRPANAGVVIAKFLNDENDAVRENATNALARLRAKDGIEQVRLLLVNDRDPIVRANAARILGATEDKTSVDPLIQIAIKDVDQRVRVSAIRALGGLVQRDFKIGASLIERGETLLSNLKKAKAKKVKYTNQQNELLEIATTLGRVLVYTQDERAIKFLKELRASMNYSAPEAEIAFARIDSEVYFNEAVPKEIKEWQQLSSIAQGLGEIANVESKSEEITKATRKKAVEIILKKLCMDCASSLEKGEPDVLRAYAGFKPNELEKILRENLTSKKLAGGAFINYDVMVRATAAELLGALPPSEENTKTLAEALQTSLNDELNDAALSILDALGKQKNEKAIEAVKTALKSKDYIIRRRAVAILKEIGAQDFSSIVRIVQTKNTDKDYKRALARNNGSAKAIIETEKGPFTINLLPEDAPLTVDNFINLAKSGYFKNNLFHRVVPNFVIQGGDPRGDGNGGPGYQIRCEINTVEYKRGAVGMALSGKDTGGSQWFVTHSPQPHLDGGYTVFGLVEEKYMQTVDRIIRGDRILNVKVIERRINRGKRK